MLFSPSHQSLHMVRMAPLQSSLQMQRCSLMLSFSHGQVSRTFAKMAASLRRYWLKARSGRIPKTAMKFLVPYHACCSCALMLFQWPPGFIQLLGAVKYEARLEDGTLVTKSDGIEFTVKEGIMFAIVTLGLGLKCIFLLRKIFLLGHFCPAISKAVKTMKKNEKALLTVKPQCEFILMYVVMYSPL